MKVFIVLGSRNPEGQTAQAADALAAGVEKAGGEVARVFLPLMDVQRCRQCDERGWGECREKGTCVIDDDFAALADQIRWADATAFVTPVYWGDLSESMRAFTDRLRRITRHENGKAGIEGKLGIGVCVAGGGGGGAPNCCVSLERTLSTTGFNLVDMVPARRQNLAHKRVILEATGRWLAMGAPEA